MIQFFKKRYVVAALIVLALGVAGYIYFGQEDAPTYEFTVVQRHDLVQEVNVTGRVRPAESVDLAFETSGKISRVYVGVGGSVYVGQILVTLTSAELSARRDQAQANLESEQAKLDELERGTRSEEIQTYQTKVDNAEKSVRDAENNLALTTQKADTDLDSDYSNALAALQSAATVGKSALITLTDIQSAHFNGSTQEDNTVANKKAVAVGSMLGSSDAGRWIVEFISPLDGGAFGLVQDVVASPTAVVIDNALLEMVAALQDVSDALGAVPISSMFTAVEKTNLSAAKSNMNTEISSISSKMQAIDVQKATNDSNIASAESSVTSAKNVLASANDDLALVLAGTVSEQVDFQKARVKSAQAEIKNYQAQIAKTVIRSPIAGIVTEQEAKAGEIVSANAVIVSVISEANFQIEANVPEADIAKVHIDNDGVVTLDAHGRDVVFAVKVVEVSPAETIIEGVATYKVTLQFVQEDERVKSGMTAKIIISTNKRSDVLALSQRAIIRRNGEKFVRILDGDGIKEVVVETGIRSSDGKIEIIAGIQEGDRVITFSGE